MVLLRTKTFSPLICRALLCWVLICSLATPVHGALLWTWRNGRQNDSKQVVETRRLAPGGSLLGELAKSGVGRTEAYAVVKALSVYINPRKMRPGTPLELHLQRTGSGAIPSLAELRVPGTNHKLVTLLRVDNATYSAECSVAVETVAKIGDVAEAHVRRCVFTIGADLTTAAVKKGVALPVVQKAESLLKNELDLHKDIKPGDKFAIVWKEYDFGSKAKHKNKMNPGGELLAFALKSRTKAVKVFRYTDKTGDTAYYDAFGTRLNKPLTVLPVADARITSKFGMREHPVIGGHRMHKGIDVRATMGTPVHAAADGTVVRKGWGGGYGRIVILKHPDGLETRYAHLSGFAKKLRIGQKLAKGTVLGYVGTTGLVTGPHLHFEVRRDGRPVNPLSFNLEETVQLSVAEREDFAVIRRRLEKQLSLKETTVDDGTDPATKATWFVAG